MAEDGLQGIDIATVAQVGDGEGMAEAVGMGAGDAGAGAQAGEDFGQVTTVEGAVVIGCDEGISGGGIGAGG